MLRILFTALIALSSFNSTADPKGGEKKAQICAFCHRPGGMGAPLLEAQPAMFLVNAITDYQTGKRKSTSMDANVAKLTRRDVGAIAAYFASRPQPAHGQPVDAAKAVLGEARVAEGGCASCHGGTFAGQDAAPRLAGQTPVYLAMELDNFAAGRRQHPAVKLPTGAEIENVAHYLGGLK